jgi:hypothetical protein
VAGDVLLARVQRTALVVCAALMAAAAVAAGWRGAAAVAGGGVLAGVSFVLIHGGIVDLTSFVEGPRDPTRRPNLGLAALKLAGRYALLGFLAYVMIARLRLHPLGLFAGASSVVAAAAVEAVRLLRKNR